MQMAHPIAITDAEFETQVLKSSTPVLVDFWATWCGPCKMIAPVLEQIADETEGVLTIAKIDVDANPTVPRQFGVSSIPTLLLFKDGQAVERIIGFQPKARLLSQLGKHVEGLSPARS
jgi:thioredoxin 1